VSEHATHTGPHTGAGGAVVEQWIVPIAAVPQPSSRDERLVADMLASLASGSGDWERGSGAATDESADASSGGVWIVERHRLYVHADSGGEGGHCCVASPGTSHHSDSPTHSPVSSHALAVPLRVTVEHLDPATPHPTVTSVSIDAAGEASDSSDAVAGPETSTSQWHAVATWTLHNVTVGAGSVVSACDVMTKCYRCTRWHGVARSVRCRSTESRAHRN